MDKRENCPLRPQLAAERSLKPRRENKRLPAASGVESRRMLRPDAPTMVVDDESDEEERGNWRKKRKKREVELRDEEQVIDRSMATGISSPAKTVVLKDEFRRRGVLKRFGSMI